jgi:hypothetical protein
MTAATEPVNSLRNRSFLARVTAWIVFVSLHPTVGLLGVTLISAAIRRAPIPYPFILFPAYPTTICLLLYYYFKIGQRGWRYSPLGEKVPRPIPAGAKRGEIIDTWVRIGKARGAARWTISSDGLLINPFPFVFLKVFIPWEEVLAIRPHGTTGLWAIDHRAEDVRSPILCTNAIVRRISRPEQG